MKSESKLELTIRLLIFVLIILIPFQIYFDVYNNISITVAECILFLLLIMIMLQLRSLQQLICIPDRINLFLLLFLVSMILSSILAINPIVSMKYVIKWSILFCAYFAFYWGYRITGKADDMFSTFILTGCIITLMGTSFFIFGPQGLLAFLQSPAASLFIDPATIQYGDINWFRGGGTGGTFFNRNWYAAFMGMIIPYCLIRTFMVRKNRYIGVIASLILISGVLISMSRGGWLGFISFIIVWLYMQKKHFWKIAAIVTIATIVMCIGVALFFPDLWTGLFERTATVLVVDYKINRILIWSHSLNALQSNPFLGIGVANNPIGSAHSNYLQILVEEGLLGLTFFMAILVQITTGLHQRIKSKLTTEDYILGLGLLGSWTWFIVQGILSTTLFNDKMFMTVFCLLGISVFFLEKTAVQENPG